MTKNTRIDGNCSSLTSETDKIQQKEDERVKGNDENTGVPSLRGRVNDETLKRKECEYEKNDENVSASIPSNRRSERTKKPRLLFDYAIAAVDKTQDQSTNSVESDPSNYTEAINCSEASKWAGAIKEELDAHAKNRTWRVVKQGRDMNVVSTKWIFTKKRDEHGNVKRYKARLVARGFTQQYGIDYRETFAPVMKSKSLKLSIALSSTTKTKRKLAQLDVKTAFLNAEVKEDIYISPPEGMNVRTDEVLKLNKALYGIKQAPHEWNNNIDSFIISLGFKRCVKDTCVYVKMSKKQNTIILCLFVDDMMISYVNEDEREWFELKSKMMRKYELTDIGEANKILGMRVTHREGYTYIDQQAYIREKLDEFNMSECITVSTPGDVNAMLGDKVGEVNRHLYLQIVGSLMHATHSTRPDITHATNIVCRFMSAPDENHMRAAKRVLRYLSGCVEYGLRYKNDESVYGNGVEITAYCDADWGGDKTDRKSTTGYCVYMNNNLITWDTKKQQTVALSTAEAELMAIVEAVKEVKWVGMLVSEMGYQVRKPILIHTDNQSAMNITKHDTEHGRTKHVDIKHSFVRDEIKKGEVEIKWISSQQQMADTFTKTLTPSVFLTHREKLVQKVSESN